MPVLGESPSRRTATAYPQFSGNYMQQLAQMATLVAIVFLLRNVFFYDYRADEIKYLTASGKTADEIKEFVPPTSEERRESTRQNKNDLEQLKLDVTMLKQQVQTLTSRLEERDEHRGKDHKHSEEQEGQPLEKIRFQEEEDKEIGATKKRTLKTDDAKPKEPPMDLSQLGEVPEGDLLSGG